MTLRVKFEIVPHGDEDRAYELGRINVHNLGVSRYTETGAILYDYAIESHGKNLPEGRVDVVRDYERSRGYLALATIAVNIVDRAVSNTREGS